MNIFFGMDLNDIARNRCTLLAVPALEAMDYDILPPRLQGMALPKTFIEGWEQSEKSILADWDESDIRQLGMFINNAIINHSPLSPSIINSFTDKHPMRRITACNDYNEYISMFLPNHLPKAKGPVPVPDVTSDDILWLADGAEAKRITGESPSRRSIYAAINLHHHNLASDLPDYIDVINAYKWDDNANQHISVIFDSDDTLELAREKHDLIIRLMDAHANNASTGFRRLVHSMFEFLPWFRASQQEHVDDNAGMIAYYTGAYKEINRWLSNGLKGHSASTAYNDARVDGRGAFPDGFKARVAELCDNIPIGSGSMQFIAQKTFKYIRSKDSSFILPAFGFLAGIAMLQALEFIASTELYEEYREKVYVVPVPLPIFRDEALVDNVCNVLSIMHTDYPQELVDEQLKLFALSTDGYMRKVAEIQEGI